MNIVVAGASGYIGRALLPSIRQKFPEANIVMLSRSNRDSEDPKVSWKKCDLFSLKELEASLPGTVDIAFYLVHSMGPTAQLDQGSFADYDLILADNFGRAMKKAKARHVLYLGGLIPDNDDLSLHLRSRLEVEETFRSHELPMTVFRAGIIIGEDGSSTQIMVKLVARLPVLLCPAWTRTLTSPVDLKTVIWSLTQAALVDAHVGKIYDLATAPPLAYIDMMRETAFKIGKNRRFITVPAFSPRLSRLWVSLVTNTPRDLVYPLIQSLAHPMVAHPERAFPGVKLAASYRDLIANLRLRIQAGGTAFPFRPVGKSVRSVQRLPLPAGKNAEWVRIRYTQWLPRFMRPLVRVTTDGYFIHFAFSFLPFTLLQLELSPERSAPDRQLLYLRGGILHSGVTGRLEFREVLAKKFVLAAIHEYHPRLPWVIYKFTQARVHLFVMRAFGRKLMRS